MIASSERAGSAGIRKTLIFGFLLLGAGVQAVPAAACISSERSVFYVEFDDGSAALPGATAERFRAHLLPSISGQKYVDSYFILASGDVAEGAAWNAAPARTRAADVRLGWVRYGAIRAMLESQPRPLRSKSISVKIRDNRQVLTEAEMRANPRLTLRTRAAIVADIRIRAPKPRKGEPVPTC